jgi:hypothetical protein
VPERDALAKAVNAVQKSVSAEVDGPSNELVLALVHALRSKPRTAPRIY